MRVSRIFLAADAAHVVNPFGGYGAMTAILDVAGLADCLIGYYDGRADESILDLYAEIRREKFLKYVDERSMKNMHRIWNDHPDDLLQNDKLFKIFQELEGDPQATKDFLLVSLDWNRCPRSQLIIGRNIRASSTTSPSITAEHQGEEGRFWVNIKRSAPRICSIRSEAVCAGKDLAS